MRKPLLPMAVVFAAVAALPLAGKAAGEPAKTREWEDTSVNSINRLPPRAYAMPLAD